MKYLGKMKNHVTTGLFVFAAALFLFAANVMEVQAYIQTEGTVVSESAVIRKEPSTTSNAVASIVKGDKVTINNEETDSNGVIWYKVFVDANTLGYVRGDLIQKDGDSAPITITTTTTDTPSTTTDTTTTDTTTSEPVVDTSVTVGATTVVTPVQSQGASVTGELVRVRAEASTNSSIVTQVKKSTAITVNGQATGDDGKVWYKASFIVDGKEVTGFIRSDFVQLTEDIVIIEETTTETPEQTGTEAPPEAEGIEAEPVNNDYALKYEANAEGINEWYLYNNVEGVKNKLSELLDAAEGNGDAIELADAQFKKYKTIIIIMAIVLVFLALAVTMLLFKIRDMYYDDFDTYDDEPEEPRRSSNTTPRTVKPVHGERQAARPNGNGQNRPQNGQRSANGQSRPQNGQRPGNGQSRPQGANAANGQRPGNGQSRPQGANAANGQRPGNGQSRPQGANAANGQRPGNGQSRPQGANATNGQRPVNSQTRPQGTNTASQRPANSQGNPQGAVAQPKASANTATTQQDAGWKPKNFLAEDDDLEFEFLNWNGEER